MKRLIIHCLVFTLIVGGTFASPAIMACSMMPSSSSADHCTLCQADPADQQHASAMTTTCVVSACASMVAIDPSLQAPVSPERVATVFYLRDHSGRLLEGPDPFPPRHLHA